MKRIIAGLCTTLALGARADVPAYYLNEPLYSVSLTICLEKEDAVRLVNFEAKEGFDAVVIEFNKAPHCANVPLPEESGAVVGRVVHSVAVVRKGEPKTLSVVEILVQGKVVAFFMTTRAVRGPAGEVRS